MNDYKIADYKLATKAMLLRRKYLGQNYGFAGENNTICLRALQKQIPVEPYYFHDCAICPSCDNYFDTDYEYCPWCGQRIKHE